MIEQTIKVLSLSTVIRLGIDQPASVKAGDEIVLRGRVVDCETRSDDVAVRVSLQPEALLIRKESEVRSQKSE